MDTHPPIIVFCHLHWDFVYQRPQHLLSRLAQRQRVIIVEEPVWSETGEVKWHVKQPAENVTVYLPLTCAADWGFQGQQLELIGGLLPELLEREGLQEQAYVVWFYTPLAFPLIEKLAPCAVVFDCMDQLAAFKGAPPEIQQREDELLARADVVFTGGRSLYRVREGKHPNLHCLPSSVDAAHFRRAQEDLAEPADQRDLPHPRLGYFGVIDERMDLGLLDALATAHPEWQLVIVGPVVKIDETSLPRHPNLHYLGQRDYAELPAYLGGWDVCLLPFALNESTQFISPTKTLEYMAAEKPIVSTPITDVVDSYSAVVYIAEGAAAFIAACERALAASPEERERRAALMRDVLAHTSWDATAMAMQALLDEALAGKTAPLTTAAAETAPESG